MTSHFTHKNLQVISETIFPANLLTGAKHSAFSTNHFTDIGRKKNKATQTRANESDVWFRRVYVIPPGNRSGLF